MPVQELNIQLPDQTESTPNIVEDDAGDESIITTLSYYTPVPKKVKKEE